MRNKMLLWLANHGELARRKPDQALPIWERPPKGDRTLNIRMSRNTLIAIFFSLFLHLLALLLLHPRDFLFDTHSDTPQPLTVTITAPSQGPEAPAAPPEVAVVAPQETPKPKPKKSREKPRKIIAVEKPRAEIPLATTPEPVKELPLPRLPTPSKSDSAAPTDMMSYVNAARAKRAASEGNAAQVNAEIVAKERGPTEEEKRDAIIKRNLQPGTNGIFQIINKDKDTAQFSFRGWTNDYSLVRRQYIEVSAGPDGDINRAIVRKMIALIRQYYQGDFNWDSQRLGRVIVLSARVEDNAGLEDFLITEFFGPAPSLPAQ